MAHPHTVTGYVANDPKMIETKTGRELAVFKIAENKRFFDREAQQWADAKPTYYDVAVDQDGLKDNVLAGLQKGQRVSVDGNYSANAYLDHEGKPRVGHQMWANDVATSMMHETQHRGEPSVTRGGPDVGGPDQTVQAQAAATAGPVEQPGVNGAGADGATPQWGVPPPPASPPQEYGPGFDR